MNSKFFTAAVVAVAICFFTAAAGASQVLTGITGNETITIPDGWKKIDPRASGFSSATIFAGNERINAFAMVLYDDKTDASMTLAKYAEDAVKTVTGKYGDAKFPAFKSVKVNGHNALRAEAKATIDGQKAIYLMTVIEYDGAFRQVGAYTLDTQYTKLKASLTKIADGLTEVDPDKNTAAVPKKGAAPAAPVTLKGRDGKCTITVPASWKKIDATTSGAAQLIACNPGQTAFVMVLTQTKKSLGSDLDGYGKAIIDAMGKSFSDVSKTDFKPLKVGEHDAIRCEMNGTISNEKLKYLITVIETNQNYQQVIAWSPQAKYEKFKPVLEALANGFTETLNGTPDTVDAPVTLGGVTIKGVDKKVSLKLPGGWREEPVASIPSAQIVAGNPALQASVAVISFDRTKVKGDADAFLKTLLTGTEDKVKNMKHAPTESLKVNGHDAVRCEIEGDVNGQAVTMLLTVVATDDYFHEIQLMLPKEFYDPSKVKLQAIADGLRDLEE